MTRGQVDPPLPAENKARRDMHTYELRPSKEQEWHWYTVVFLKFTPQASELTYSCHHGTLLLLAHQLLKRKVLNQVAHELQYVHLCLFAK
jgi:hypothetical protein